MDKSKIIEKIKKCLALSKTLAELDISQSLSLSLARPSLLFENNSLTIDDINSHYYLYYYGQKNRY